jgi:hypothetical protein
MKQFLHWLLAAVLITMLAACGGGGGSAGVPGGSQSPSNFLVNAPNEVTISVGQRVVFPISGGRTPYITSSTVSNVAGASIENGRLVVTGNRVGETTIRVAPTGGGAEFRMAVSVVTNTSALVVQAPDVVSVSTGRTVSYTVLGGVPPYRAVSTDDTILQTEVVGSQLRLTGLKRGSVAVDVYDADLDNMNPVTKLVNVIEATPLSTAAPATGLTVAVGASREFTITGGVAPYFAESNNTGVLDASVRNGATLALQGVGSGSAITTLRDSAGSSLTVSATVVVPQPFFINAPPGLVMSVGVTRDFEVGGGVSPYLTPVSTNEAIAIATLSGTTLRITSRATGSATITLRDAAGAVLSVPVTVGSLSPFFTTAPGAGLVVGTGDSRGFAVGGGTLPYADPVSTNILVATASINADNNTLTISGHAAGTATISLRDANGASLSVGVTVTNASPFYTTAPATGLVIGIETPVSFEVGGGSIPYTWVSTNQTVATASISGNNLQITGRAQGEATITVREGSGVSLSIPLTVSNLTPLSTSAPSTGLVLGIGQSLEREFDVDGGKPSYTVVSSNTAVATARFDSTTEKLVLRGIAAGSATITVRDAAGASVGIALTVSNTSPFFTSAPSTGLFVGLGVPPRSFDVGGGVSPYSTPTSSNEAVATASIVGNSLSITGRSAGLTTITLRDAAGTILSIPVTVGTVVPFYTTAPTTGLIVGVGANNARDFEVGGGVMVEGVFAPYVIQSSNAAVVGVSWSNGLLRITGNLTGTASVTLRDAAGTTLSIPVTVNATSPFYTTAPSTGLVLGLGTSETFAVGGGVLPYVTPPTSTNKAVATATLDGTQLVITGHTTGTTAIGLRDAAGTTLSIPVSVGTADNLLTTAPGAITMEGEEVRGFVVRGGTGYSAQSSNRAVVEAIIPATPDASTSSTLTLTAVGNGTATVLVTDSRGRSVSVNVTVVNGTGSGVISSVDVTTDKLSLLSASGEATISAFVKNAANVAMANIPVQFSADSGTLLSAETVTNASGVATAKLSPGSNKANREITVTAKAGVQSGSVKVTVTGSTLTITGSSTQQLGAAAAYSVRAVDSSGNALAGLALSVRSSRGNLVSPTALTTDTAGNANFSYTASVSGTDTLTVTGPGIMSQSLTVNISAVSLSFISPASNTSVNVGSSSSVTVEFLRDGIAQTGETVNFSSTRGAVSHKSRVTDGSGRASIDVSSTTAGPAIITAQIVGTGTTTLPISFVATTPSTITLQATPSAVAPNQSGSTANQSTLSAVVRDVSGNLVAGQTVNFNLVSDLSGGSLSAGTAVTDANGRAEVQFIAGASSTPANGVQVSATVAGISNTARVTVNSTALFISFGISNEIDNLDPTIYTKRYAIYVTDATGIAVGNQVVNLSVIPTNYRKGTLSWNGVAWVYSAGSPTQCPNEDVDRNGIWTSIKDTNGDGRLTPGNVVAVFPGSVTTDAAGRAYFDLQYGEQFVPWIDVQLSARAAVSGTESIALTDFSLVGLAADFTTDGISPAGVISPFGTATSCADPS